jgi:hypothetical protein
MDSSRSGKDEIWFLRMCHHVPHELYPIFLPFLLKLKFSRNIVEKYSNVKFHETVGPGLFHACKWTDRNDEANSRFSQCSKQALLRELV